MTDFNFDVLILGSGPAGNTAGIYLARNKMKIAMITGMSIGGQLTTTTEVENFPGFEKPILGSDLMQNMMNQSKNLGVKLIYDAIVSVDFSNRPYKCILEGGDIYYSNYIIISMGAKSRWLGLPSEEKFKGRGVSACATCDGSFYKAKDVAVVGGGSSAGTEAIHLSHICNKVYLIHRKEDFKMAPNLLKKINLTENIEIITQSAILDIIGNEEEKAVEKIKILNLQTNLEKEIFVSGIFMAIGRTPATDIFKNTNLKLDEYGYIITKPDSAKTNIDGVYAAGDITNKFFKQAISAAGYGCIAALEIQKETEQ